jgi:hypothetical protein
VSAYTAIHDAQADDWHFSGIAFSSNKWASVEDVHGIARGVTNWRIAVPRNLDRHVHCRVIDDFHPINNEISLRVHRVILAILNGC